MRRFAACRALPLNRSCITELENNIALMCKDTTELAPCVRLERNESADSMRIAVLSDTHGHLNAEISHLVESCDAAIHAGDIGGAQMLRALRPQRDLVFAVAGNNDIESKWPRAEHPALRMLPEVLKIDVEGLGQIVVEHGHRIRDESHCHEELRSRYPNCQLIVYGHTHKRVVDQTQMPWVMNPGAAGSERTGDGPSCLIAEISDAGVTIREHVFSLNG